MSTSEQNRDTIIGVLTALSFAMFPVYLFSSGGFQIVDAIIVLISLIIFLTGRADEIRIGAYYISPFIPFIVWSVIINSYYSAEAITEAGYLLTTIQLIFGFYILFLFSMVFNRILSNPEGRSYLYWGLLASCITPWMISAKRGLTRNALSFNNPNQLAYYSILILSMLILVNSIDSKTQGKNRVYWILTIIVLAFSNIFVVVSVSRAGLVVVMLLDIYLLYALFKEHTKLLLLLVFMLLSVLVAVLQYKTVFHKKSPDDMKRVNAVQTMNQRFAKHDIIENLQKRISYVRTDNDFIFICGSGGQKFRLQEEVSVGDMFKKEAHNAIMEIYDSYGVIGILLFLGGSAFFLIRLGNFPYKWFFFATMLLYNIAHNGFRFRCMWVAIALISVVSLIKRHRINEDCRLLTSLETTARAPSLSGKIKS